MIFLDSFHFLKWNGSIGIRLNFSLRLIQNNLLNLSFGLSSSDSEEFAPQILGFSDEVNGQGPFTSLKSTRGASKLTESEGEKPKTQVFIKLMCQTFEDSFEPFYQSTNIQEPFSRPL